MTHEICFFVVSGSPSVFENEQVRVAVSHAGARHFRNQTKSEIFKNITKETYQLQSGFERLAHFCSRLSYGFQLVQRALNHPFGG